MDHYIISWVTLKGEHFNLVGHLKDIRKVAEMLERMDEPIKGPDIREIASGKLIDPETWEPFRHPDAC